MSSTIQITGLTARQKQIMELMWGCTTQQQVNTLIAALPDARDRWDAKSLIEIALQATLEAEGELDAHKTAAQAAISRARYS